MELKDKVNDRRTMRFYRQRNKLRWFIQTYKSYMMMFRAVGTDSYLGQAMTCWRKARRVADAEGLDISEYREHRVNRRAKC